MSEKEKIEAIKKVRDKIQGELNDFASVMESAWGVSVIVIDNDKAPEDKKIGDGRFSVTVMLEIGALEKFDISKLLNG